MKNMKSRYGKTAMIAGASEGLGLAYSRALAAEGMDLVMLARDKEKLEKAASGVKAQYNVNIHTVSADLGDEDIIKTIISKIDHMPIDVLIYDAGMPYIGPFVDAPIDKHIAIAKVNMEGPLRLVHHYGKVMLEQGRGAIVLMSSIAGFQGAGFLATYSSTKAFNRQLAESLWYEWKDKGVDVIACSAGTIATPDYLNTNPADIGLMNPKVQQPEEVVAECFAHLGKVASFVSGSSNRFSTFLMSRLMPRQTAINLMGDTTRKLYRIKY